MMHYCEWIGHLHMDILGRDKGWDEECGEPASVKINGKFIANGTPTGSTSTRQAKFPNVPY